MENIYELSNRIVEALADADPMMATAAGISGRDHLWTDLTPNGHDERRNLRAEFRALAADTPTETRSEILASRVLTADLTDHINRHDSGEHLRDLNNIVSPFQDIKDVFDVMARDDFEAWSNIVTRLDQISDPIDGYRECLVAGIQRDMVSARRQVEAVIEEGRVTAGADSPFAALIVEFDETEIEDGELRSRLCDAVESARKSYGKFTDWLASDYLPVAPEADAVGSRRYLDEAAIHLGSTIDLEDTYQWGWREVDELWAQVTEACAAIDPSRSVREVIDDLESDPTRGAASTEEFVAVVLDLQHQALEQLAGTHFDVPDEIRTIDVKISPPGGALSPYYSGPSEDFSRIGTIWYPLGSREFFPLWDEVTTAYHEGFPGHHLQEGIQMTLGDTLSRYHRLLVWQPGSGEGWALYAERLMHELGYLDKPEYVVGILASQLMRSCRVVIDIGMHCSMAIPDDSFFHPGEEWSFETAVEMLTEIGLISHDDAVSEVTRYLGWPGQAITYKLGEQVILDLRDELSASPDFDLKEFHTKVLEVGSIGLDLLQEMVRS